MHTTFTVSCRNVCLLSSLTSIVTLYTLCIQMYRNYDGFSSTFGDVSVSVSSNVSADDLSVFAATRESDGAITIMAVSKVRCSVVHRDMRWCCALRRCVVYWDS